MLAKATLSDVLRPRQQGYSGLYDIGLIIGGSLFIGASAHVAVVLPFSPVPVTGQTFAVLMSGMLMGRRRAALCIIAYIIQGAVGLPVFALGRAGVGVLLGPTGGYLAGFIAAAYIVGLLAERGWDRRVETTVLTMVIGNVAIYAFGLLWLGCLVGISGVLAVGLYPFIVGDVLKIVIAAVLLPAGWKLLAACGILNSKF